MTIEQKQDFISKAEIFIDGYYNKNYTYPSEHAIVANLYEQFGYMTFALSDITDIAGNLIMNYGAKVDWNTYEFQFAFRYFFDLREGYQSSRVISSLFILGGLLLGYMVFKKR